MDDKVGDRHRENERREERWAPRYPAASLRLVVQLHESVLAAGRVEADVEGRVVGLRPDAGDVRDARARAALERPLHSANPLHIESIDESHEPNSKITRLQVKDRNAQSVFSSRNTQVEFIARASRECKPGSFGEIGLVPEAEATILQVYHGVKLLQHHRAKANRSLEHIRRTRVVRHGEAFGEAEAVRLARVLDDQALERNTSPGGRK